MITENELVALLSDLPNTDLRRGDVGTAVYVYEDGKMVEVEFVNATGETLAVTTLQTTQVKRIDHRGAVLHVNERILTAEAA